MIENRDHEPLTYQPSKRSNLTYLSSSTKIFQLNHRNLYDLIKNQVFILLFKFRDSCHLDRIETRSSGFLRCVKSRVSDPKTTLNPPDQADCCFDFGRFASFLHLDRIETRTFAFLCSMKSRVSHVFFVGTCDF